MSIILGNVCLIFFLKIVACQVVIRSSDDMTDYCMVKEPHGPGMMNISRLMKQPNKDMIIRFSGRKDELRVNFCKPLVEPCKNESGYSICYRSSNGVEVGLGRNPPVVNLIGDKVIFQYTGDICNENSNYSVIFEMNCDKNLVKDTWIDLKDSYTPKDCDVVMPMDTAAACPSTKSNEQCILQDESGVYSLLPLTRHSGNYLAYVNENVTTILNICRRAMHVDPELKECDESTAICLRDESDGSSVRSLSLGRIERGTRVYRMAGHLFITFVNGSACVTENNQTSTIESTITFICNMSAMKGAPFYLHGLGTCEYEFMWLTAAACSEHTLRIQTLWSAKPCSVVDPIDNHVYDLSIFKDETFRSQSANGEYWIGVCSALQQNRCRHGSAVCEEVAGKPYGISGGMANQNLKWNREGVTLNYTDGNKCKNGGSQFTTVSFSCGGKETIDVVEQSCSTLVYWTTDLMCRQSCVWDDIDLRQLKESKDYYVVRSGNSTFVLSVCRNTVHKSNFSCPHGAGVCRIDESGANSAPRGDFLGYSDDYLRGAENGVVLKYLGGPPCNEDEYTETSSEVAFVCSPNVRIGYPTYKGYVDCVHHFEWKTRLACHRNIGTMDENCVLTSRFGDVWDLSALRKLFTASSTRKDYSKLYTLNVCGQRDRCNGFGICDASTVYGNKTFISFDYLEKKMLFEFTYGSACSNGGHGQSALHMICDEKAGIGEPIVAIEKYCYVEITWKTNLSCILNETLKSDIEKQHSSKGMTTSEVIADVIMSLLGVLVVIGVIVAYATNEVVRSACSGIVTCCIDWCRSQVEGRDQGFNIHYRTRS